MSWIKDLSARRLQNHAQGQVVGGVAKGKAKAQVKLDADELAELGAAGVSEKVLAQYGASLRPSMEDLRAITRTAAALRPHRANLLTRALDRFYGDLAKQLGKLPDESRDAAAGEALGAVRKLVERVGANESIVGAIAALQALLFVGKPDAREIPARTAAATAALDHLLDGIEGRTGGTTALFGVRNLLELSEKDLGEKPTLARRQALWSTIFGLVLDGTPPNGADQAEVGLLVSLFHDQLKVIRDPFRAAELTQGAMIDAHADSVGAILGQLDAEPKIAVGSPGRLPYNAVVAALRALLERHRTGPASLLQAVEAMTMAVLNAAPLVNAANQPVMQGIEKVVGLVAGSPAAEAVLRALTAALPRMIKVPACAAPLLAANAASDVPRALIQSQLVALGQQPAAHDEALKAVDRLPPVLGQRVAIAILPHLANPAIASSLLSVLPEIARSADTLDFVVRFATSFAGIQPQIARYVVADQNAAIAALALELNGVADAARAKQFGVTLHALIKIVPGISIPALLRPTARGDTSLVDLRGKNELGRDPLEIFRTFAPLLAAQVPDDVKVGLARRLATIASQLARLDREPKDVIAQVQAAWTEALAHPENLHFALRAGGAVGVRAQGQASLLGFFEAHPELPPEVAITAGLALSSEQLGWLCEQMKTTRSHGKVRLLRDLVFMLVQTNQQGMFDGLRTIADPKLAQKTLAYLVTEYRQGRADKIPFAEIAAGLQEKRDPLKEIEDRAHQEAFAALGVGAEHSAGVKQAGLGQLNALAKEIAGLLSVMQPGAKTFGDDSILYRSVVETCLGEVAAGTWPHFKFEGPIADKELAGLTPEQRRIWAQEDVTTKADAAAAAKGPAEADLFPDVRPVLAGLVQVLPQIPLSTKELPKIAWTEASQKALRAKHEGLLATLHKKRKGSKEHKRLSAEIGPVAQRLALLDLFMAMKNALADPALTGARLLFVIKGVLPGAHAAAAQLAGAGVAYTLSDLMVDAKHVKAPVAAKREGVHVVDEHNVEAFFTAFDAGCIAALNGSNRASTVELLASAQYKVGRTFDGKKPHGRTILRLMQVEIGKYKGYAIRVDPITSTGRGGAPNPEQMQLMYKHMMKKALAMGLPCLFQNGDQNAGKAAADLGLAVHAAKGTFGFHRGHTGVHHTEGAYLGQYFTAWNGVKADSPNLKGRVAVGSLAALPGTMGCTLPPGVAI